jgi:hypothetical protein
MANMTALADVYEPYSHAIKKRMPAEILPLQQKKSSQHTASRLASAHTNGVAMLLGYLVTTVPPDSATCWHGTLCNGAV